MVSLFQTARHLEDLALFVRHVADAMATRTPLPVILRAYAGESASGPVADAADEIADRVEAGATLSQAMEERSHLFPETVRRLARLGEESGSLPEAMTELADSLEHGLEMRERTRRMAIYPLTVLLLLFLLVLGIATLVLPHIPKYTSCDELGAQRPTGLLYRFLNNGSDFAIPLAMHIMMACILVAIAFLTALALGLRVRGTRPGRFVLTLPLIGPAIRLAETAQFARYFGLLIRHRIPAHEALELVRETTRNGYVRAVFGDLRTRYESGERLGTLLTSHPLFPPAFGVMVSAVEQHGNLGQTMARFAEYYDRRFAHGLQVIRELSEPILIALVALIVSVTVAMALVPILELQALFYLPPMIR